MAELANSVPSNDPTVDSTPKKVPVRHHKRVIQILGGAGKGLFHLVTLNAFNGSQKAKFKMEEVAVYCVHRSFFLWAMIFFGFLLGSLIKHYPVHAEGFSWAYIMVVFYTIMMVMFDFGTMKFALLSLIFGFVYVASLYLETVKGFHTVSIAVTHIRNLHPVMSFGFAAVLGHLLLIPWVYSVFEAWRSGKKTFSPNGIEERRVGEGSDVLDRSGLHFVARYRDLLETILGFGCGDIEARDGSDKVVRRYENVMFLYFRWKRIDEILLQRAAVVDNSEEDPVEVEDVRR